MTDSSLLYFLFKHAFLRDRKREREREKRKTVLRGVSTDRRRQNGETRRTIQTRLTADTEQGKHHERCQHATQTVRWKDETWCQIEIASVAARPADTMEGKKYF